MRNLFQTVPKLNPQFTDGRNLSEVTYRLLGKLIDSPDHQLSPHQIHLASGPSGELDATTLLPGRGNNPFATAAETLWVCAGRDDVSTLEKWLPRARQEDHPGSRIRNWALPNGNPIDQVAVVLQKLKRDRHSQQAIIMLWDPARDGVKQNAAESSNNLHLQFLVRNGGLDLHISTCSSDLYALTVNIFQWCFLGHYVADFLGVPFQNCFFMTTLLSLENGQLETARRVLEYEYLAPPKVELALVKKEYPLLLPGHFQYLADQLYLAAYQNRLDQVRTKLSTRFYPQFQDFFAVLKAETLIEASAAAYLGALKEVSSVPLLFSLLDIGMRRRKEALWLKDGFAELWCSTKGEIAAAKYLRRIHNLNSHLEDYYVCQKSPNHDPKRVSSRGSLV